MAYPSPTKKVIGPSLSAKCLINSHRSWGLKADCARRKSWLCGLKSSAIFSRRHSRPTKLHQGILIVNVLQPTVLYELDRQWKALILTRLKGRFGGKLIKELRFRLG